MQPVSPKQVKHREHSSWADDTLDWHLFQEAADLVTPTYKGGHLEFCLPSQRSYSQPYLGHTDSTEPTPLNHQDGVHWKEPYLPFQRR